LNSTAHSTLEAVVLQSKLERSILFACEKWITDESDYFRGTYISFCCWLKSSVPFPQIAHYSKTKEQWHLKSVITDCPTRRGERSDWITWSGNSTRTTAELVWSKYRLYRNWDKNDRSTKNSTKPGNHGTTTDAKAGNGLFFVGFGKLHSQLTFLPIYDQFSIATFKMYVEEAVLDIKYW